MNEEQLDFINHHKIDILKCLDVKGSILTKDLKLYMKIYDFYFAYNCSPCKRDHTIKNRLGQCIFCNTQAIAIHLREHGKGNLYIAASRWGKWIKIGCTTNYEKREKYLNEYKGYGFKADWKILAVAKVDEMGVREREVHYKLEKYREYGIQYYRGKELKRSNELFRCNYEKAYEVMQEFCKANKFHFKVIDMKFDKYNFRKLIRP